MNISFQGVPPMSRFFDLNRVIILSTIGSMKTCALFLLVVLCIPTMIFAAQQPVTADGLTARAKQFIDFLAKEDFANATKNFDATMAKVLPEEKVRELWTTLNKQVGAYKKQVATRTDKAGKYDVVFVTCEFERMSLDAKIVFDNQQQITGLFFLPAEKAEGYTSPDYVSKDFFIEKEVTVGTGDWALPATLTLPKGDGPFAAVVLVHGSGPHDRDETIGRNKPFRDLAWGLASQGIAVLRYEKRTKQHPEKLKTLADHFTVKEEVTDDALAAVALLKKSEKINPQKIFVIGHSLGGYVLPRIGKGDSSIAGLISLAGATRPLEDVLLEQYNYIYSLDGKVTDEEQKELEKTKAEIARVKSPNLKTNDKDLVFGGPASYWLDLRGYNPPQLAETLKQPMLILQGEKDYQVTMQDFANWKAALAKRKNVEFKSYANLYHLFIETADKPAPANYEKAGHVARYVIDDIAAWIKRY
jgi:dienelactone hydrolase